MNVTRTTSCLFCKLKNILNCSPLGNILLYSQCINNYFASRAKLLKRNPYRFVENRYAKKEFRQTEKGLNYLRQKNIWKPQG